MKLVAWIPAIVLFVWIAVSALIVPIPNACLEITLLVSLLGAAVVALTPRGIGRWVGVVVITWCVVMGRATYPPAVQHSFIVWAQLVPLAFAAVILPACMWAFKNPRS